MAFLEWNIITAQDEPSDTLY